MSTALNAIESAYQSELVYEFTTRVDYLLQYAGLVDQFYKKDLDLDLQVNGMRAGLERVQENERVYIVRHGDRVIAGTKLSYSSVDAAASLPMEEGDFRVDGLLPEGYGTQCYAEIGRLVLDPEYRGRDILQNMIADVTSYSVQRGCGYLFVLAPALNAVLYRRVCRGLGMRVEQHKEAGLPDKPLYRRLDIKLLSCDIRALEQRADGVEQTLPIAV